MRCQQFRFSLQTKIIPLVRRKGFGFFAYFQRKYLKSRFSHRRTWSQTGMVHANQCNSKLLLLSFVCLSSCCKPTTSGGEIPQLLSKLPGGSLIHILSTEITLSRSTHQKPVYEVVKKKPWRRDFWKLFWLVLEMQTVLAISAKAQIWAKYLLVIVIINITTTNVSYPWRIIYYHIIYRPLGITE